MIFADKRLAIEQRNNPLTTKNAPQNEGKHPEGKDIRPKALDFDFLSLYLHPIMKNEKPIPQHVAIIMDGNGRWAKQRGKERTEGHIAGVESIRATIRAARNHGVKYVTF